MRSPIMFLGLNSKYFRSKSFENWDILSNTMKHSSREICFHGKAKTHKLFVEFWTLFDMKCKNSPKDFSVNWRHFQWNFSSKNAPLTRWIERKKSVTWQYNDLNELCLFPLFCYYYYYIAFLYSWFLFSFFKHFFSSKNYRYFFLQRGNLKTNITGRSIEFKYIHLVHPKGCCVDSHRYILSLLFTQI